MEVFLYVADDIQSLADNKTLMVGAFTDRVLILSIPKALALMPSEEAPIAINSLAVMLTVTGLAPGDRIATPVVKLPDGRPSLNLIQPMKFPTSPTGAANLLFKFAPFVVTQPGKYTVSLTIDDQQVEASFEIKFNEI